MAAPDDSEKLAGVNGELAALTMEQACRYYQNYLDVFQVSMPLAVSFINRMLEENIAALPAFARIS